MKKTIKFAYDTSDVMNNIPDIINAVVEFIMQSGYKLSSVYRLNRLVRYTIHAVNNRIFSKVSERLKSTDTTSPLKDLLKNRNRRPKLLRKI
jgi:hypothetical protein